MWGAGDGRNVDASWPVPPQPQPRDPATESSAALKGALREDPDIILVGVSRSGKTPTCLYLALQFGIKAANYPLTEEDLDKFELPDVLKPHRNKLFGLTIDPERLAAIRNERKAHSRYASIAQCYYETEEVEHLYQQEQISFLSTTDLSVEEISTKIMLKANLDRKL